MKQAELISQLQDETKKLIKRAESFCEKDALQLKHQKNNTSWSNLQCIEHLNHYSKFYLKEFELRINKGKSVKGESSYKRGFWGKLFTNGMLPDENMKKMKTFKKMNPSNAALNKDIINQFIQDQEKLLALLEKARKIDLNKNNCRITLPIIRMRIGDTLTFYVYHNIRHITQAKNALNQN